MLLFAVSANTGRLPILFNKLYYVVLLVDSEILTILALKPALDCKNDAIPTDSLSYPGQKQGTRTTLYPEWCENGVKNGGVHISCVFFLEKQ